jgi:hypothetical protein
MIGVATLGVAFRGYFSKASEKTDTAHTAMVAGATLMDNISIRLLSEAISNLSGEVVSLERELKDNTHWVRSKHEQDRELCQRLRELKEAMERRT